MFGTNIEKIKLCIKLSNGQFVCLGDKFDDFNKLWHDLSFFMPGYAVFVREATDDEDCYWTNK